VLFMALASSLASAQTGTTASLGGVVVDDAGGVIPGATVMIKNEATGVSLAPIVTNAAGVFSLPALDPGVYTVTVSLSGFKTAVVNGVRVVTVSPANLKIALQVGELSETVNVAANSEVVQTQATTISSTINGNQIANLPLVTRNALNFMTFLPGVDTGGTHSQRASTVAGLPNSALAISIDGVNTQDNLLKSSNTSGFFSIITPSVDAIEEVTLSTATPGADASAQGAVQIRFTTRSGTNTYTGSAYEYFRHPDLNSNSFFNKLNDLPRNQITLHQYGARLGGPIAIPGIYSGHGRSFFFVNYEEFYQPSEITRTRTIMNPLPTTGVFTYTAGGVQHQVNVLGLAAANHQIATVDPLVGKILGQISAAVKTTGTVTPNSNPNTSSYVYQSPSTGRRHFPTVRLDFNLGARHRLSGVYNFQKFNSDPDTLNNVDPEFPGFPVHGSQYSYRNSTSITFRSTLTPNLVNEVIYGNLYSPVYFFGDVTPAQFAGWNGLAINLSGGGNGGAFNGLTRPWATRGPESRNGSDWNIDEKLTWQKGRHSLQFGENFTRVGLWQNDWLVVPAMSFGVDTTNDPAAGLFVPANFPGLTSGSQALADARQLYGLLTGRVTSIAGEIDLDEHTNEYTWLGTETQRARMDEVGTYVQDAWRVRPNATINAGLRYELQFPFQPLNSIYATNTIADLCGVSGTGSGGGGRPCNLFKPGTLTGVTPTYKPYASGTKGYNTDYNNLAPSVGLAWQPNVQHGLFRGILGNPEQATVRAAWAVAYNREGLSSYTGVFSRNPGAFVTTTRNVSNGNLVYPGESWPLLLQQTSRLGPPAVCSGAVTPACYPLKPEYPVPINRSSGVNLFDPNYEVGHTNSYTVGLQRSLSRDMAIELRYVGTRNRHGQETQDWNEVNLVESGFLDEFTRAQTNLYANIAAGRGQTFAYFGPGSGTSPLPIYLAHFSGSSNASNPAAYTSSNFTSSGSFVGQLARLNPNPQGAANALIGNATFRSNLAKAGLPSNLFVLNPDVSTARITVSDARTRYDSLQIDVRRRLANGLAIDANYTYAVRDNDTLDSLRVGRVFVRSTAGVPHALKVTANFDVPFGRGKRFGADANAWLDGVAGGWSVNLTGRVQSGQVLDFGNVRLVGMTVKDLQKAINYRFDRSVTPMRVYDLPADIIENTSKAFNVDVNGYVNGEPTGRYLAPANGPDCVQVVRGECAPRDVFVVAPVFTRFDLSAKKSIRTGGKTSIAIEYDVLNIFNAIDFNPRISTSTNIDDYRVTSAYSDVNGTFDPGGRLGQLVVRFNW
jgi:hypothetical protein